MLDSEYKVLDFIWHSLRCYSPMYASLGMVTRIIVDELQECECTATITDDKHRDYRTIDVDNHQYRILRGADKFSPYDVKIVK